MFNSESVNVRVRKEWLAAGEGGQEEEIEDLEPSLDNVLEQEFKWIRRCRVGGEIHTLCISCLVYYLSVKL